MEYNDNELVALAIEHNEDAIRILHEKYMPLINKKASKIYKYISKKGVELADIKQECLIGFEEAIKNFNPDQDALFFTFANLCMDRQMNSLMLKVNRNKHKILNEAISIDIVNDQGDSVDLLNLIPDNNTEDKLMDSLIEKELMNEIKNNLTHLETLVFGLKIQGFSYKEIADILDKDVKSIDNAVQRIKAKLKEILKDKNY